MNFVKYFVLVPLLAIPLVLFTARTPCAQVHDAGATTMPQASPAPSTPTPTPAPIGDDTLPTIWKWLAIAYAVANALNNYLPWPDKAKQPKLYAARYALSVVTIVPHGTFDTPVKSSGPAKS